ncbi:MAG: hypothetical protein ACJ71K_05130, partial [Nitrososphaeraceae archaeon]
YLQYNNNITSSSSSSSIYISQLFPCAFSTAFLSLLCSDKPDYGHVSLSHGPHNGFCCLS